MPILSAWGLPISCMTLVGNILFAPVLTLFLLVSSVIYLTQYFSIPNCWLIIALEKLTAIWEKLTQLGSNVWLIGIPQQSLFVYIAFIGVVVYCLYPTQAKIIKRSTCVFFCIFVFVIGFYTVYSPSLKNFSIPYGKQHIHVMVPSHDIVELLLPQRFIMRKESVDSWLDYVIIPEITKKIGTWQSCNLVIHKRTASVELVYNALKERGYKVNL